MLVLFYLFTSNRVNAQNISYAKSLIKTLCSDELSGRGYVNDGDHLAAELIRKEFARHKLIPLGENYFQPLGFPVIYYPGSVDIDIDGSGLIAGTDFILNAGCPAIKGAFKLLYLDSASIDNNTLYKKLESRNLKGYFLVVDELKNKKCIHEDRLKAVMQNSPGAKGLIYLNMETLTWSVSLEWALFPVIYVKKNILTQHAIKLNCNIEAFHKVHGTQNVTGYIKGSVQPDSFIVITAHYDHLGMLGKDAIFPGANDNASGVAMMIDMARHFSLNRPKYSILFIAFAGEEIGLIGSFYFVEHPLVALKKMCLLLNLDLMATGDKGLTAVNATEFPELFENLKACNSIGNYLPVINPRGKAMNSDHYYFSEAGVPAFFFYLMGEYHQYHDVGDKANAISLSRYNEAFQLIVDFANMRMEQ
ncbi:MAG: M28 family peptidase [Bacteroidia bacterium]|nr:M28 family peptidase [Bacteroidia bacterium]